MGGWGRVLQVGWWKRASEGGYEGVRYESHYGSESDYE